MDVREYAPARFRKEQWYPSEVIIKELDRACDLVSQGVPGLPTWDGLYRASFMYKVRLPGVTQGQTAHEAVLQNDMVHASYTLRADFGIFGRQMSPVGPDVWDQGIIAKGCW